MSITILLADDHKIMRDGLRSLLEREPDLQVVAEADTGRQAVRLALEHRPAVVIMDISMPDLNGIDATRQIIAGLPEIKVVVMSMHADRRFVTEALRAGTSGFLLKDCAIEELIRAIHTVVMNQTYLTPAVIGGVIDNHVRRDLPLDASASARLTEREREVLQLLAEGRSTKDIAAQLHVSGKTVETHRRQLMQKLNLHSVAELTKFAIREGLTSP